jgi:hypothetical protein
LDAVALAVATLLAEGGADFVALPLAVTDGEGDCDRDRDRVALPEGLPEGAMELDSEQLGVGTRDALVEALPLRDALALAGGEADGATDCDGDTGGEGDAVSEAEADGDAFREADGDGVLDGVGSAQLTANT